MISEERSCQGKTRYQSRGDAKRARRRIYGHRQKEKTGALTPYLCPFCDHFHLGHMPADVRNGTWDKNSWLGVPRVRD